MRMKFTIMLTLLLLASLPSGSTAITTDTNHGVPAPVFRSLNDTGSPAGSHIYDINTDITISYRADRFDVDGLILLGSGSGLTEDPNNGLNFEKVSSRKANSFYEVELTVTTYTYFYAYAWSGTVANGTVEELDLIGYSQGHELWVEQEALYPSFDTVGSNATIQAGDIYVPRYKNITLQYKVQNSVDDSGETATIAFAENSTVLYDNSIASWEQMTRVDYQDGSSIFEYELNMTEPIVYFTAMNDYGWERSDANTPVIHRITNGFSFNETFVEELDLYTTLDDIDFNVTTFNETTSMEVGYQYRYFANESSDEPIQDWSEVILASSDTEIVNTTIDSRNGNTTKTSYEALITDDFEVGNLVEIQPLVKYGAGSTRLRPVTSIVIIDPAPTLEIDSKNGTITNKAGAQVKYRIGTPKGDITSATLIHTLPTGDSKNSVSITSGTNRNITFSEANNDTVIEGYHTVELSVTNSLGITTTKTLVYHVDQTAPNGTLNLLEPSNGATETGLVTVEFTFEDLGIAPSNVSYVTLDWGNNMTIEVTSRTQATHTYRFSDDYTITLTIWDKAGNSQPIEVDVIVSLPPPSQNTDTGSNPVPFLPILAGMFVITTFSVLKKRKINN